VYQLFNKGEEKNTTATTRKLPSSEAKVAEILSKQPVQWEEESAHVCGGARRGCAESHIPDAVCSDREWYV